MSRISAAIAIIVISPLIILLLFIYLISGQLPIFFRQTRIGQDQRPFDFYKLKTLKNNDSQSLQAREFLFGKFLRRTSLDELPQLWNILIGEMSFVGPRPLLVEYLPYFSEEQKKRFNVKPGLTGLAQVNGRTSISWDEKLKFDVEYVQNQSLALDIKIILNTVKVVLMTSNANSLEEVSFIEYLNGGEIIKNFKKS